MIPPRIRAGERGEQNGAWAKRLNQPAEIAISIGPVSVPSRSTPPVRPSGPIAAARSCRRGSRGSCRAPLRPSPVAPPP